MTTTMLPDKTSEATTTISPYDFLIGTLPSKLPSRNEKVDLGELSGQLDIQPITEKVKSTPSTFEALSHAVCEDDLRPAMTGVYHDLNSKSMCVTNGHYLVVIPDDTITEDKIVSPKSGDVIPDKFPDYRSVIPFLMRRARVNDIPSLLSKLKGVIRAGKFTSGKIYTAIRYDEQLCFIDAEYLHTALMAMAKSGSVAIDIELPSPGECTGIVLRDVMDADKFALVMLVNCETDTREFKPITSIEQQFGRGFVFSTILELKTQLKPKMKIINHYTPLLETAKVKPDYVLRAEDDLRRDPECGYSMKELERANEKWGNEVKKIEAKLALAEQMV